MKYIIELPEEVKEKFDNATKDDIYGSYYDYNSVIGNAIKNGTPLPKGHGRLIDADELSKRLVNASMFYRGETADMFDTRFADGLREADIKLSEAPTVVEANKENK
jgi:hypothetical protein